ACAFGLTLGALVPLVERFFRDDSDEGDEPEEPKPKDAPRTKRTDTPQEEPLELDDEPPLAAPKPNVVPPKSRDGCPGCGRVIPGTAGERYCMLCDKTF